MTDKPENPQAFPHGNPTHGGDTGMTLRDYFAGQALAGSCALPDMRTVKDSIIAEAAYSLADAMLKERSK